jgi:hypothetical protein
MQPLPYRREFIRYQDNMYDVIRKYTESKVKSDKTDDLRQHLSCDVTLRRDGMLYFCRKIEEAQIIE